MNVDRLFEEQLVNRGLTFSVDAESGRYAIEVNGSQMLVSLENLKRDMERDGEVERVARFVDSIVASSDITERASSADQLYWCLEPNEYVEKADFRVPVSDRVDRVLVHLSSDSRLVTWVTDDLLRSLEISEADAGVKAFANLARALTESTLESRDIDGVQLGFFTNRFRSRRL